MKNKIRMALLCMFLLAAISGCIVTDNPTKSLQPEKNLTRAYEDKKILYIDSYHEGYEWSDGEVRGVESVLNNTGVELKIHRMDTKRNDTEAFGKQAGLRAKSVIEEFKPDVVIACDDPAFIYLIMPYYKDAALPFVFCGMNWDVSIYGAPYKNTAGMIEVSLTPQLISYLKGYSRGDRIGFIAGNTTTDLKNAEYYKKLFNITLTKRYHVKTFEEWKKSFLALQDEVDILIIENKGGITNWDDKEAEAFAVNNTKIPSGATQVYMTPYSLIGFTKIAEEQGEWAGGTALLILNGTRPSDIPVVANKKGMLYVNLKIANKLGKIIDPGLLKNAKIIR